MRVVANAVCDIDVYMNACAHKRAQAGNSDASHVTPSVLISVWISETRILPSLPHTSRSELLFETEKRR